jgi:hypothetical protein
MGAQPEYSGSFMLFAIALPFLFVYLRSPEERWWALIPAGILGTTALLSTVVMLPALSGSEYNWRLPNILMYLGIASTFAFLWLRHHKSWGLLVSVLAVIMAGISWFSADLQQYWPALIILVGIYMLYNTLRPRSA